MLLGTLGDSLLRNLLTDKGTGLLMSPHPVSNFEMQKYYQNDVQLSSQSETKFNGDN